MITSESSWPTPTKVQVANFLPERRYSRRLVSNCQAEVVADVTILDIEAAGFAEPLVFLGHAIDLSAQGVALSLPAIQIDERYCNEANKLTVSLQLPEGNVELAVAPVRCVPLDDTDRGRGYLMGVRIIAIADQQRFDEYLQTLSPTE